MLSNLAARDVETLIHPYTHLEKFRETGPLVIERGEGVHVFDAAGKPYLEGMAGLWCTSLGYSNRELAEAAREQMERLPFQHLFSGRSHDPAIALAEALEEIAPVPISKVTFCSSGSEANDTQVKLAWYMNNALGRPRKKKIIARLKGYHGVTVVSGSLTGLLGPLALALAGLLGPCGHRHDESQSDHDSPLPLHPMHRCLLPAPPPAVAPGARMSRSRTPPPGPAPPVRCPSAASCTGSRSG